MFTATIVISFCFSSSSSSLFESTVFTFCSAPFHCSLMIPLLVLSFNDFSFTVAVAAAALSRYSIYNVCERFCEMFGIFLLEGHQFF